LHRYVNSGHVFHVRDAWPVIPKLNNLDKVGFGSMRPPFTFVSGGNETGNIRWRAVPSGGNGFKFR
jgi:hypothetical protein